jgi:hypothetical protein
MLVKFTISVETLRKNRYKLKQGETMNKKVKEPKITKELGVGKDGYQTGGVEIKATDPMESQVVDVRGTKRMRPDKKPVKATWY